MPLTITWGTDGLPMPDISGIGVEEVPISSSKRSLSGRLHVDVIARYHKVTIPWPFLSVSERATLQSAYNDNRDVPSTLLLPDGQSFANVVCISSWQEAQYYELGSIPRYNVTLEFEETLE